MQQFYPEDITFMEFSMWVSLLFFFTESSVFLFDQYSKYYFSTWWTSWARHCGLDKRSHWKFHRGNVPPIWLSYYISVYLASPNYCERPIRLPHQENSFFIYTHQTFETVWFITPWRARGFCRWDYSTWDLLSSSLLAATATRRLPSTRPQFQSLGRSFWADIFTELGQHMCPREPTSTIFFFLSQSWFETR